MKSFSNFLSLFLIYLFSIVWIPEIHGILPTFTAAKLSDDYYSSLIGVQNLAKQEQLVVAALVEYKRKLTETLELISYYLDDYKQTIQPIIKRHPDLMLQDEHNQQEYPIFKSEKDLQLISEETSANPLMVFKLIRRFASELGDIEEYMNNDIYHSELKDFIYNLKSTMTLPNIEDMQGAADGLLRIQETYQLPTNKMSTGVIIEKKTGCKLLASDMLFIGARAVNEESYATGLEWMYQAYQHVLNGDDSVPEDIVKGHLLTARTLHNQEFMKFRYPPSDVFSNLVNSSYDNIPELYIPPAIWEYPLGLTIDTMYDIYNFNALCRGEKLLPLEKSKNLRCWYSHTNSPVNIISPLKVELHHDNPPVFQVYDLISDEIIDHIKKKAAPILKRANVVGDNGGTKSDVRTSSVAWLKDRHYVYDHLLSKIPIIVKRASGLELEYDVASEELQVSCYGSVGGHYIPHLDALLQSNTKLIFEMEAELKRNGDRIATLMFYLSDVELGGGTAFPRLGVAAKAIKGSAVFWYNLKKSGNIDSLTLHGGCPVLYGNKWVANKWIRLYDQIHVRKCSKLESD